MLFSMYEVIVVFHITRFEVNVVLNDFHTKFEMNIVFSIHVSDDE